MPIDRSTIADVPLFADLDDAAVARVCSVATEVELHEGAVLIELGQPSSGLFLILSGVVRVELRGREVELGPGEVVGELGLLTDTERTARVRATSAVRCVAIARDDFDALLDQEPAIAVPLLRTLARRLVAAR